MKPRNVRETQVIALLRTFPKLSEPQLKWIGDSIVPTRVYTTGHRCWCSKCGSVWNEKEVGDKAVCPHCGTESKVERSGKTANDDLYYAQFIQTYNGWQVVRMVLVRWYQRKGIRQRIECIDIWQKWCQAGKPTVTVGTAIGMSNYYRRCPYSYYPQPLTVKFNDLYYFNEWMECKTYPRQSLLPVYRKVLGRDLRKNKYDITTQVSDIMSNPYLERLYKEQAWDKLKEALRYTEDFCKYWPSVRIALKHGYEPPHWGTYFEHLKALRFLHYDMCSPRYVAPSDFGELHDFIMRRYRHRLDAMQEAREEKARLRAAIAQEEYRRKREEEAKECAESFAKRISHFADLKLTDGIIVIAPLMSIEAFKEEGDAMHHCVFNNGYWKKKDSLVLSARNASDNERVETIEISLKEGKILQSFGIYNTYTERHDEICALVNGAMPRILQMAV